MNILVQVKLFIWNFFSQEQVLFCATIALLSFFLTQTLLFLYLKSVSQRNNSDWIDSMQLYLNVELFFLVSVGDE